MSLPLHERVTILTNWKGALHPIPPVPLFSRQSLPGMAARAGDERDAATLVKRFRANADASYSDDELAAFGEVHPYHPDYALPRAMHIGQNDWVHYKRTP